MVVDRHTGFGQTVCGNSGGDDTIRLDRSMPKQDHAQMSKLLNSTRITLSKNVINKIDGEQRMRF